MIAIEAGDPRDPSTASLLEQSRALMEALFPSDENHYLSLDELCAGDIYFYIAREGSQTLGTGALAVKDGYGEIKSMFVREDARRRGVAEALLRRLIDQGTALGLPYLRLETGNKLNSALRLYGRHGFDFRGPFGDYEESATSLFMEKKLGG